MSAATSGVSVVEDDANGYIYKELLDNVSPRIEQTSNIKIRLMPHQLAEIHKARNMEQNDIIKYCSVTDNTQIFNVRCNIGLLSDIVGYGKTMTALGIIASCDVSKIHVNNVWVRTYRNNGFSVSSTTGIDTNEYIKTTLVVVPRGPVYLQWQEMIEKNTKLKVFSIDNVRTIKKHIPDIDKGATETDIRNFLEKYDIVLIKTTNLKQLITYIAKNNEYHRKWSRIVVDEAHDTLAQLPMLYYRFLWMVTGTPKMFKYSLNNFGDIREIIFNETRFITVKSDTDFVKDSFNVLPYEEIDYRCYMSPKLNMIRGYLNKSIVERINAGDVQGALREMGVKEATVEGLISRLTEGMKRDIQNKSVELNNLQHMVLTATERENKEASLSDQIRRSKEQLMNLEARIQRVNEDCAICMDQKVEPVFLDCTHSFCLNCIMDIVKRTPEYKVAKCPECRTIIERDKITMISDKCDDNAVPTQQAKSSHKKKLTKEETLLKIINKNKEGKFLVFSRVDNSFDGLMQQLKRNNITCAEIKGNTSAMKNILNSFKEGSLKVILLNTRYAGSGIDISCATDVIIYHHMGGDKTQAVGRAQRVGRNSVLKVHNLLYPNEVSTISNPST